MGYPPSDDHSLDRIDNDLGYSPENCRWAGRHTQASNRHNTARWEWGGETLTIKEWAVVLEDPFSVLDKRFHTHGHLFRTRNVDFHYVSEQHSASGGHPYVVFSLGRQQRFRVGSIRPGEDAWDAIVRILQT